MFVFTNNHISYRHYCKYIALICLVFIVFFCGEEVACYADEGVGGLLENIESQLGKLNVNSIEAYIREITSMGEGLFKGSFLDNVRAVLNGEKSLDYASFISYIVGLVFDDLLKYVPLLAGIVAICIVCSLLGQLSSGKEGEKISKVIYFACLSLVAVMIFSVFKTLLSNTTSVLTSISKQMQLIFPILLTMMTSIGSVVSVSIFKPAVAMLSSSVVSLISSIVLPIFIFSFIFNIVGNMSANVKLEKCSKFLSSLFKWLIGTIFTVFTTILSLQGILASVTDSVSIKTAKYAIKNYIPLVGGFMSDGLGFILASSVLIKNAVGITGLLILASTIIVPLVEIVIFALGLKLVAAVVEPLSNNGISNFIYGSAKCLNMLIACIVAVGFMYLLAVGLFMCTSNIF